MATHFTYMCLPMRQWKKTQLCLYESLAMFNVDTDEVMCCSVVVIGLIAYDMV